MFCLVEVSQGLAVLSGYVMSVCCTAMLGLSGSGSLGSLGRVKVWFVEASHGKARQSRCCKSS